MRKSVLFLAARGRDIYILEEANIGDSSELLFDVDFDRLVRTDIIPQEKKDDLPKRIVDRKRIGYTTAKKEGAKSYAVLEKLGLV